MTNCNNCGKPVVLNKQDYIFLHENGSFWCDKTKTIAVDVTDPKEFGMIKAGFNRITTSGGKPIRFNPQTGEYVEISPANKPLNSSHNQEIYKKYGI